MPDNAQRQPEIPLRLGIVRHIGIGQGHVVVQPSEAVVHGVQLLGIDAAHMAEHRDGLRRPAKALHGGGGVEHDGGAGKALPHAVPADEGQGMIHRRQALFPLGAAPVLAQQLTGEGQLRPPVAASLGLLLPGLQKVLGLRLPALGIKGVQLFYHILHRQGHRAGGAVRRAGIGRGVKGAAGLLIISQFHFVSSLERPMGLGV